MIISTSRISGRTFTSEQTSNYKHDNFVLTSDDGMPIASDINTFFNDPNMSYFNKEVHIL